MGESVAFRKAFSPPGFKAEKQTHKIISHEKLCFVIVCCDAVFRHQSLHISVHVHLLDDLFYLPLALEFAKVFVLVV